MFCDSGVFDFLEENYAELHTQGREFFITMMGKTSFLLLVKIVMKLDTH